MIELYPCTRFDIDKGDFPLNHDSILKVRYISDCPIRFQYFSCRAQDTGLIMDVFCKLSLVKEIKVSSVDDLPDIF